MCKICTCHSDAASKDSLLIKRAKVTGELDRRRAELKQILKDAGYFTDPHALEDIGFKLVSGRNHWKLEYAGIRMPIAKTPYDYRANLNMTQGLLAWAIKTGDKAEEARLRGELAALIEQSG